MDAYGLVVELQNEGERRIRYRGLGTFIDIWNGKRGMTVGVYQPLYNASQYYHFMNDLKLEDILIKLQKEYDNQ